MSMTRKHYEFMADWIARNATSERDRWLLTGLALATIKADGNPRFDRVRFERRIADLTLAYGSVSA